MDAGQWSIEGIVKFCTLMGIIFGGLYALGMTMRKD
jgi:hypothetical protein